MKVRACVYVNPLWGVPFAEALEHSLIELGIDALEKIRYYLKNEDERNELAEKYYKSVVKKTYTSSVENALRRIL